MKRTAQQLASMGRNGDTQLLHVSNKELDLLHGIGSLTGRHVTTNPHTGLPEAFSFSSLIPAIVGIGATVASGGTLSPLMAGMISGAATTATTGSLSKGLMAGISGGAMSGLGAGLSEMGTAAGATGEDAMSAMAPDAVGNAASTMSGGLNSVAPGQAALGSGFNDSAPSMGMAPSVSAPMGPSMGGAPAAAMVPGGQGVPGVSGADLAAGQSGIGALQAAQPGGFSMDTLKDNISNPDAWKQAFGGDKLMTRTLPGVGALGITALNAMRSDPKGLPSQQPSEDAKHEHHMSRTENTVPDRNYPMTGSGEPLYFSQPQYYAAGGLASLAKPAPSPDAQKIAAIRSHYRSRKDAIADINTPGSMAQKVGLTDPSDPLLDTAFGYTAMQGKPKQQDTQYMAGGGYLKGPGDGMSDSIHATINGKQPARLANNEFVVPADAVSHLGNGSSDAGARELHDMVSRIRQARTGTSAQAPQVNPRKVMPS